MYMYSIVIVCHMTYTAGVIKSVVSVDAGQFDAQEMGCVDVPVAALYDNPHWFSSQGALQNLAQLLSLQQISSVCGIDGIPVPQLCACIVVRPK